jgi:hypothetical protein
MLLGLHTTHLITDAYDTLVLEVLVFTGPLEGKRFVDVSENCGYWYFVVFSWLPIYAVIYWGRGSSRGMRLCQTGPHSYLRWAGCCPTAPTT